MVRIWLADQDMLQRVDVPSINVEEGGGAEVDWYVFTSPPFEKCGIQLKMNTTQHQIRDHTEFINLPQSQ
jgi:hypothetical protein